MAQSLATKAQMTGFGRIDMAQAAVVREALLTAQSHLGVRISYTDMILKVCAIGLREMPEINAYIDGNDIVTWNDIHIGLAVSVEGGLLVPVIRHVDRLSLADIARARLALIAKARSGKLTRDDLDGGTFTLSNFGSYDGDFETPILNAPQSALLGIGKINDEAVVRDEQIVIRPMMSISLTFDHCLVDGSLAGRFRARIKVLLEEPALLLAALQ
jgi:pyruvate/2-oxoglutarate dehydrogenase complex dihydrolipoamide acyltransferase (E2) component